MKRCFFQICIFLCFFCSFFVVSKARGTQTEHYQNQVINLLKKNGLKLHAKLNLDSPRTPEEMHPGTSPIQLSSLKEAFGAFQKALPELDKWQSEMEKTESLKNQALQANKRDAYLENAKKHFNASARYWATRAQIEEKHCDKANDDFEHFLERQRMKSFVFSKPQLAYNQSEQFFRIGYFVYTDNKKKMSNEPVLSYEFTYHFTKKDELFNFEYRGYTFRASNEVR